METNWEILDKRVSLAQNKAKAPISGFHVGAIGSSIDLSDDSFFHQGYNVEFINQSIHKTFHAEQTLVSKMIWSGSAPKFMYVTHTPCGHCRQFLLDMCGPDLKIAWLEKKRWYSLFELVPFSFSDTKSESDSTSSSKHSFKSEEGMDSTGFEFGYVHPYEQRSVLSAKLCENMKWYPLLISGMTKDQAEAFKLSYLWPVYIEYSKCFHLKCFEYKYPEAYFDEDMQKYFFRFSLYSLAFNPSIIIDNN